MRSCGDSEMVLDDTAPPPLGALVVLALTEPLAMTPTGRKSSSGCRRLKRNGDVSCASGLSRSISRPYKRGKYRLNTRHKCSVYLCKGPNFRNSTRKSHWRCAPAIFHVHFDPLNFDEHETQNLEINQLPPCVPNIDLSPGRILAKWLGDNFVDEELTFSLEKEHHKTYR